MSFYLKNIGLGMGTSVLALDVLAESTITATEQAVTLSTDSDTKKLIISAVTSILSTLVLKIYEDLKKRRRAKRPIESEIEKSLKEG